MGEMQTKERLNRELFSQDFPAERPDAELLKRYREMACNYARLENAVAVLSDMRSNVSYIYYGGFAHLLGLHRRGLSEEVSSIWEEAIFRLIHPDDLDEKHLQELCFFHFIKRQPKRLRSQFYLASRLRMRTRTNNYIAVQHRMFYILVPSHESMWLALCLYSPLTLEMPSPCVIVNSATGQLSELKLQDQTGLLSDREKQVLGLIDRGFTSKGIADMLSISVHTVSRHRQEILGKLQVKNSIEACRVAKGLHLI